MNLEKEFPELTSDVTLENYNNLIKKGMAIYNKQSSKFKKDSKYIKDLYQEYKSNPTEDTADELYTELRDLIINENLSIPEKKQTVKTTKTVKKILALNLPKAKLKLQRLYSQLKGIKKGIVAKKSILVSRENKYNLALESGSSMSKLKKLESSLISAENTVNKTIQRAKKIIKEYNEQKQLIEDATKNMPDKLFLLNVKQLKEKAKKQKIKAYYKMRKHELINAIKEVENDLGKDIKVSLEFMKDAPILENDKKTLKLVKKYAKKPAKKPAKKNIALLIFKLFNDAESRMDPASYEDYGSAIGEIEQIKVSHREIIQTIENIMKKTGLSILAPPKVMEKKFIEQIDKLSINTKKDILDKVEDYNHDTEQIGN